MGVSEADAVSSVRLSIGKDNTADEILKAVTILVSAVHDLKKKS